jgi:Txe/YoeB family toxin of Txe-Axe toxin-antitoxin module
LQFFRSKKFFCCWATADVKFANAINEFLNNIKRQVLDIVSKSEHMSIPQIITVESLRLWIEDPGNQ